MSAVKLFRAGFLMVLVGLVPIGEALYQGALGVRARESLSSQYLEDFHPLFDYWSVYDSDIRWEQPSCDSFGYSYLYRLKGGIKFDSIQTRCVKMLAGDASMRMPVFAFSNGDTLSCAQFDGAGTICVNRAGKAVSVQPNNPEKALDIVVADAMGFQRGWALGYGYILCFYLIIAGFTILIIAVWRAISKKFSERRISNSNEMYLK